MTAIGAVSDTGEAIGLLDKRRIIAKAGFNRWLVPPAALAIHLCIGMAYGFSVFWLPLSRALGDDRSIECPGMGLGQALFTTTCDWRIADLGWMYTLFFVLLGISAATWGGWLERAGPRKAGVVSAFCWCGGLLISALGVVYHQLWMLWLGSGVIGGIGLGLGYISPVSTLIKWFPDRRGMATGMAIMGFGGGAMIGAPLANLLMNYFRTETSVGVWQTFVAMAAIYFVFMLGGAFGYRLPPAGWKPEGWTPRASRHQIATRHVHLSHAHKVRQFWLIWGVLCLNVSAGIGVIGIASPMLQEIFGGRLDRPARCAVHRARSSAGDRGGDSCRRIHRAAVAVQHRRAVLLGVALRRHRAQGDLLPRSSCSGSCSTPPRRGSRIPDRSRCSCSRSASSSRCMAAGSRRFPPISPTSSARISSARSTDAC